MNNWKPCCTTCFYAQNYWVETASHEIANRPRVRPGVKSNWVKFKTECHWVQIRAYEAPPFVPRVHHILGPDEYRCDAWKCSPNVAEMAKHHEWKKGE